MRHPKRERASKQLARAGALKTCSEVDVLLIRMEPMKENNKNKGGRKPKEEPCNNRHVFRLTDAEHDRLMSLFKASGMTNKARFIVSVLFNRKIKTVKIDRAAMDYYTQLTELFLQFQSVGVNYNQIVKILYRNFSDRKAAAYLFKLEKKTVEMAFLCKRIIELTERFEQNYIKERKHGR